MYTINEINGETSTVIAIVDEPNYIFKLPNGDYGLANESTATAVNVNGIVYHLDGREEIEGVTETVRVSKVDGGFYLNANAMQSRADIDFIAMETGVEL